MLLGGIWHGAGWGFVIWGFLHGAFLMIEHGFRALFASAPLPLPRPLLHGLGWGLTFLAVILAWVPFRAVTLDGAIGMWGAMAGLSVGTEILTLEDEFFAWIAAGLVIVTLLPNSQEIVERLVLFRLSHRHLDAGAQTGGGRDFKPGRSGPARRHRRDTRRYRRACYTQRAAPRAPGGTCRLSRLCRDRRHRAQ